MPFVTPNPGMPRKKVPVPGKPKMKPLPVKPPSDDKIIRMMPITEKQLGQIKRHYGIK